MVFDRMLDLFVEAAGAARVPNSETARIQNEQAEILAMFSRVEREARTSGRSLDWHLLSVLDWTDEDVGRRGECEELDRERQTRQSTERAIESLRDLLAQIPTWLPSAATTLVELEGARDRCNALEQLRRIDVSRRHRKTEHVKAAAMRVLMETKGLAGPAQLTSFIDDENEKQPPPCPNFAHDDSHGKVRTILSRSKL